MFRNIRYQRLTVCHHNTAAKTFQIQSIHFMMRRSFPHWTMTFVRWHGTKLKIVVKHVYTILFKHALFVTSS